MQTEQLILLETFCTYHHVEVSFLTSLHEYGLVEIVNKEDLSYIPESKVKEAEQLVRLHNDLELSPEGLEIVCYLLDQLKHKDEELNNLQNKLRFYE
ncbi:MAG: chaperone modulator CbpM [Bacteroidota bacterium]